MGDSSFTRSLLRVGGGLQQSSFSRPHSRQKSRTQSQELRREDLDPPHSCEKRLTAFLRWKEFTATRREAWDLVADEFSDLRRQYQRLEKEQILLQSHNFLAQLFTHWHHSVQTSTRDWRRGPRTACWRVLRRWRGVTQKRKTLRDCETQLRTDRKKEAQRRFFVCWKRRFAENVGLRSAVRRYRLANLVKFAFVKLRENQVRVGGRIQTELRLIRKSNTRCIGRVFAAWIAAHRNLQKAVKTMLRFSSRAEVALWRGSFSLWKRLLFRQRKLRRLVQNAYISSVSAGFCAVFRCSLQAQVRALRHDLASLPSVLEKQFFSSCEDRIRQMSAALQHDKVLFQREKACMEDRVRRIQSVVSSQASRLYGELNPALDASTIRREDSETRIKPDNP